MAFLKKNRREHTTVGMFPQTSSHPVALITAPILAICLTACGYFPKISAEAAPPANPSPSASPTPNPEALKVKDTWTDVELPTQPDLSDESLQGGANAAAYFLELFWHVVHTKDYKPIEEHIIPGSGAEFLTKKLIKRYTNENQIFEGDEIASINNIGLHQAGPEDYIYVIDFDLNPGRLTANNYTKYGSFEYRKEYFAITIKYIRNNWKLKVVQHGVLEEK